MTLITCSIKDHLNKDNFYAVNQKTYKIINNQASGGAVGVISFALDKQTIEYERVVYSFIDMFGFLGGIYDFMYFCGYICIFFFQNRLFNYAIFSNLYHVEVEPKEEKLSDHEDKTNPLDNLIKTPPNLLK